MFIQSVFFLMQILFPSSFCALSCLSPFTVHAQSNRSLNHMFIHWDAESGTRDEQVDLALNIATFAYEREVHRVQVQITREYERSLSSVSSHHSSMRHLISLLFLFCRWFIFLCLTQIDTNAFMSTHATHILSAWFSVKKNT